MTLTARSPKRLEFGYGRTLAVSRAVVFTMLLALALIIIGVSPPLAWEFLAILGAVVAAAYLLFCVSPLLTKHWLTSSRLILRQGWYFRAIIPIREIEAIRSVETLDSARTPLGIRRPLGRPTLFVTGGRTGLISIRLVEPRRFLQALGLQASEIVFDVTSPRQFLDAYEARRSLFAPVQAEGAHA